LIHGFGFANALSDLAWLYGTLAPDACRVQPGRGSRAVGDRLPFLPAAFSLRNTRFYQNRLLRFGSMLIIVVAGTLVDWSAVFNFKLLTF